MEGILKYLLQNYHILGILLIVTVIAVKLFTMTRKAKKIIKHVGENGQMDRIESKLDIIQKNLDEMKKSSGIVSDGVK